MSPFMLTGVEIKDLEEQLGGRHSSNIKPSHRLDFFRMQFDTGMLKYINGLTGEHDYPRNLTSDESICSDQLKASSEETSTSQTRCNSETFDTHFNLPSSSLVGLKFWLLSQHEVWFDFCNWLSSLLKLCDFPLYSCFWILVYSELPSFCALCIHLSYRRLGLTK